MNKPSTFVWHDGLCIGNDIIDNQHKKIISVFAEIDRLIQSGETDFTKSLFFLTDYLSIHLLTEEELMKEINFPLLPDHEADHNRLRKQLASLFMKSKSGQLDPSELMSFIQHWADEHILKHDIQLRPYLENNT